MNKDDSNNGRNAAISLKGVAVELGGREILKDVAFDVEGGEFVAILGPNGAGKTTLFRLLLGLVKPSHGTVAILGRPALRGSKDIGYAPQHRVLETDLALRAKDVVGFGFDGNRWGIGMPSRAKEKAVNSVLAEVDASSFANAPVGQLSGGEQQRLLIAQALITDPKILLLDEPLSNLDISHAQEMVGLLNTISRHRGVTVMLVSHDINPLLPSANKVLYMANGKALMGTPDEIITGETLSRLYDTKVEVFRTGGRVFVVGAEL